MILTRPYASIRRPGYPFAALMCTGLALALGSLVALIPVGSPVILLAGRTLGEESGLMHGLPGYREYMSRVKRRWAPLIW